MINDQLRCFSYTNLPDWQKEIIFKYPSIYLNPNQEIIDSLAINNIELTNNSDFCNLRYGFECGEGWKGLIDSFSNDIVNFVDSIKKIDSTSFIKSCIVKQKMGKLVWQGTEYMPKNFFPIFDGYIRNISTRSLFISELSGEAGTLKNHNGYLQVMTDKEFKKVKKKDKRGGKL